MWRYTLEIDCCAVQYEDNVGLVAPVPTVCPPPRPSQQAEALGEKPTSTPSYQPYSALVIDETMPESPVSFLPLVSHQSSHQYWSWRSWVRRWAHGSTIFQTTFLWKTRTTTVASVAVPSVASDTTVAVCRWHIMILGKRMTRSHTAIVVRFHGENYVATYAWSIHMKNKFRSWWTAQIKKRKSLHWQSCETPA